MTPERWRRVKEVFDELLHAEPDAHPAVLVAACGDDLGCTVVREWTVVKAWLRAQLSG
jgi:hypothetical protein